MNKSIFRIMLAIFLVGGLATSLKVDAQTYYRCTGDKVNVRKGPGKNYAVLRWEHQMSSGLQQLYKGHVVKYLGKKQNGFMKVEDGIDWHWCRMGVGTIPDPGHEMHILRRQGAFQQNMSGMQW